jgi:[ribosomal protein S5]-alanine N-acetyltransferase
LKIAVDNKLMNDIKFVNLDEIKEEKLIELMNNSLVKKQMPLLANGFSAENCKDFLHAKRQLWNDYGFGPWAFNIRGEFAGWGGVQPEQGEADFALVLHPKFWGWGRKIFEKVKEQAFNQMNLESIIILFPSTRTNSGAISRLGFINDGELNVGGECFRRFRLSKAPENTKGL